MMSADFVGMIVFFFAAFYLVYRLCLTLFIKCKYSLKEPEGAKEGERKRERQGEGGICDSRAIKWIS